MRRTQRSNHRRRLFFLQMLAVTLPYLLQPLFVYILLSLFFCSVPAKKILLLLFLSFSILYHFLSRFLFFSHSFFRWLNNVQWCLSSFGTRICLCLCECWFSLFSLFNENQAARIATSPNKRTHWKRPRVSNEMQPKKQNKYEETLLETNRLKIFSQQHYYYTVCVSAASQSGIYFPLSSSLLEPHCWCYNRSVASTELVHNSSDEVIESILPPALPSTTAATRTMMMGIPSWWQCICVCKAETNTKSRERERERDRVGERIDSILEYTD